MKLCYVSADFGIPVFGDKGASVHIQSMVSSFLELGHDVNVVAPQLGTVPEHHKAHFHRPKTRPPVTTEADLKRAEQSDRIFKERRNLAIGQSVESLILELNAKSPFDAIYERYSLWSTAGLNAARILGIPFVLEVNAPLLLEQQNYRQMVLTDEADKIEARVFAEADLVYAVSDEVRQYCISKGALPERTMVQENGVDLKTFSASGSKASLPLPDGLPVIGFAGSLKPWHGLEDLAQAFHRLHKRGFKCGLLLAGDGPMRGWIDGFAIGAGLTEFIHVTGWVKHGNIPAYLRRMDVATAPYPKMDNFYFSPLKLFEYMACGRPVVASRIGQITHVIDNGRNGLLSEPGNPDALSDVLENLFSDEGQRKRLSSEAAKSMLGRSWLDCARRVAVDITTVVPTPFKRLA